MFTAILLSGAIGLAMPAGDEPAAKPSELAAYRSAAAAAGHDAGAHVRLALWCEAHGLIAERLKHLSLAVLYQPSNVPARGLLGLVGYRGSWNRPDVIGEKFQNDPAYQALIREYLERRVQTPHTAEAQMKLAAWCSEKRLKDQAMAHYHEVIQLDPSRDAAWRHLGYKRHANRWVKPEELAARKQEALLQKQADRRWKLKLEKLRDNLSSKDAAKRALAEQTLAEVTDPRAVPMIWATFVPRSERLQLAAVQMLGQIDGPSASNGLAALAVYSPAPNLRHRAIETLKQRDPRDVVGRLIAMVHKPLKYEVRPVRGPGSPGELFVEGERFNVQRVYENLTSGWLLSSGAGRLFTPDVPFDPFNIRNLLMAAPPWSNELPSSMNFGMEQTAIAGNPVNSIPFWFPASGQSIAQAERAIAANPQNAPAILKQLQANPANRAIPPGYWFPTANQVTGAQSLDSYFNHMAVFARQVQAQQGNPNSPLHMAVQLGRMENHPAHRNDAAALGLMLPAEQMAVQRDQELAYELMKVRQSNLNLQQRLTMDVQMIEMTNAAIRLANDRALPVLRAITGLSLGAEPVKWQTWWLDQLGYSSPSTPGARPTYQDYVTDASGGYDEISGHWNILISLPTPVPVRGTTNIDPATEPVPPISIRACFAAGTLVQTIDGPRPVALIRVGDRVLCQGTGDGSLTFRPVVATHRGRLSPTLRIDAGGESIVATGIHRFWEPGTGWTMARDLKPGDRLRRLDGVVVIDAIQPGKPERVYNVDVAGNGNLFAGPQKLLVHDFGLVQPVLEPFDRRLDLPVLEPSGR